MGIFQPSGPSPGPIHPQPFESHTTYHCGAFAHLGAVHGLPYLSQKASRHVVFWIWKIALIDGSENRSLLAGMATVMLIQLSYLAALFFLALYCGFWVYPQIKGMSAMMRTAWILVFSSFGFSLYISGEYLTHLVWSCHVKRSNQNVSIFKNGNDNQLLNKPRLPWYQMICHHPNAFNEPCVYSRTQLRDKQD